MSYKIGDRVRQTSTTGGTGPQTLIAASAGFQNFSAVLNDGDTCPYLGDDGAGNWELGIGTYHSSGPTLTRTTVLSSSNSGSAVNFGTSAVTWSISLTAALIPFLDGSGNGTMVGTLTAKSVALTGALSSGTGIGLPAANACALYSNGSEVARALSGNLLIGFTSSQGSSFQLQVAGNIYTNSGIFCGTSAKQATELFSVYYNTGSNGGGLSVVDGVGTSGSYFLKFYSVSTAIGSITNSSNTAVVYNTTSDERLKDWHIPQTDYRRAIADLWVGDFTWKATGKPGFGVRAQQAWEALPNHLGVTRPDDDEQQWQAASEPFGFLALWGVKDLYREVKALRERVDGLEIAA